MLHTILTADYELSTAVFFSKKDKSSTKSYSAKKKDSAQNMNHNVKTNETLKEIKWKPGMPCRLVYMEDGMEYEAVFIRSIENDECIVKYLGEVFFVTFPFK